MHLDVRCKFLLLLIIVSLGLPSEIVFMGLLSSSYIHLGVAYGATKESVKICCCIYCNINFCNLLRLHTCGYSKFCFDYSVMFAVCIPIMLYAQTFLKTTSVSEMVTGMYSLHLPRAFVITFAVAMRFFPTAKEEISQIKDAMALRGIEVSLRNIFKRPMILLEGLMTPLLVRASTVAEELSAASITRGLDNPMPRTAFVKLKITAKDVLVTAIFIAALCAVWAVKMFRG